MRKFCVAGLVLVALTTAAAASDIPNVVGLWTRNANASAQTSKNTGDAAWAKPSLVNGSGEGWKLKIDTQDGRAFSGTLIDPAGKSSVFVGTFRDDESFVFTTDKDFGWGEFDDDDREMKYCWTAISAKFIGTGCSIFARSK